MTPEEVDRFTRFNEAPDGPLHRVLLRFEGPPGNDDWAVLLLNDDGLALQQYLPCLEGRAFAARATPVLDDVLGIDSLPEPAFEALKPEKNQRISAWTVLAHERELLVALKSVPRKRAQATDLPLAIGIVVTGKQHLAGRKIVRAEMLAKDVPTPFIVDAWGDSYNDAFGLEPRIIESVPHTVFTAVQDIMAAAKRAFAVQNFDVAATKYQKAFHYCHKYYPESLEPADLDTATDLKRRSLLNLALAGVLAGTKPWLASAVEAADFVLDMPEATAADRAKALNRRGRARLGLGDDEAAQSDLEESLVLCDDPSTHRALDACAESRRRRLASLQKRLHSAFQ